MKQEIASIHHVALKVWNLEKCKNFYAGILGLTPDGDHKDDAGNTRSAWLKCGSMTLMLERASDVAAAKSGGLGWHLLAFEIPVEKREEWKKKLKLAGVFVTHETEYSLFFRDPEGNRLALSHYPHKASPSAQPANQPPPSLA